ncbi:MAG TPA: cupin domain-containing protein [Roseiarcus sp.]
MSIFFVHSKGADAPITIPASGLDLMIRMAPAASGGAFSIIETINAPGKGPPRHKHPEAEIFRVLEGRYLYGMDGRRFYAEAGDVVSIPGGAEHGFVNVTDKPGAPVHPHIPGARCRRLLHRACRGDAKRRAGQDRAQPFRRQAAGGISRAAADPR